MSKPVILTGIRANNDLHIGNYLGALLPMVDMAKQKAGDYQINLFVPDLHSFTTQIDHSKLQSGITSALRVFVAAGLPLDNEDIFLYRQSYIPAHSELTWILDCFTGVGEMNRMTQFKDKSALSAAEKKKILMRMADSVNQAVKDGVHLPNNSDTQTINRYFREVVEHIEESRETRSSVGLFNYPVLMAADILLYGAEYVPVGDDQTQHLEFTRDLAERMNARFGDLFVIPKSVAEQHKFFNKDQGLRIRDLQNPSKKMSKSAETGKGVLFLTDSPDEARRKIMSAETDSLGEVRHDYKERPGVSNLLDMLKLLGGNPDEFVGQTQYGPLKTAVADKITAFLAEFQDRLAQVDNQAIMHKLEASEYMMHEVAVQRLHKVQQAVGLRA